MDSDAAAHLLGGRYELGAPIGHGGMADVHLGHDRRLGRNVAIKVLRSDLARDPLFHARFKREAQSAASLNHPAIVAVYDTGEDEAADGFSQPYIVMEYVDGRTLRDVLHAEGRLLPERALEIGAEICAALDYSHSHGIVHRDIKPGNVMLTRAGAVKVMDFGIARAASQTAATMTQTAAVIGTAQYLSPEQARGDAVDARSDIYSLGCLIYELVTGQPPFTGDSPVAVAYQHVREHALPPSQRNVDVPPQVDAIVMKAMAKNPDNRYQSAAEMRDDIQRAMAGRTVAAPPLLPPPPPSTTVMPRAVVAEEPEEYRRNRAWAYVLFALLVIGVFLGAFFLIRGLTGNTAVEEREVPRVVGMDVTEAQQELADAGFTDVVVETEAHDTVPVDVVISQEPVTGTVVPVDERITLTVSAGQDTVTVPDVSGATVDEAINRLAQDDLSVREQRAEESDEPAGEVLRTEPPAGTEVPAGSGVVLVYSSGEVEVPSVTSLNRDQATAELRAEGFAVAIEFVEDPSRPDDLVVGQDPDGGSTAPAGSTVTIEVVRNPEPTTTPPPEPTTTPPPEPTTTPPPEPTTTPPPDEEPPPEE